VYLALLAGNGSENATGADNQQERLDGIGQVLERILRGHTSDIPALG